jgi:hypothetical protein
MEKMLAAALSVIVGAHEEPRAATGSDGSELALAGIIFQAEPPVVEESAKRVALANRVTEGAGERTADGAHALEDGFGPGEEGRRASGARRVADARAAASERGRPNSLPV